MHAIGLRDAQRLRFVRHAHARPVAIDVGKLLTDWRAVQTGELQAFSATLGVSRMALESLGCVYAPQYRAFAFPMQDGQRRSIGIRLRNDLGRKWTVTGSRSGLFLPVIPPRGGIVLIVEGPTDAAAAIDLGFDVVGRPACMGQEEMVSDYLLSRKPRRVYIIADNDERECSVCKGKGCNGCGNTGRLAPGINGARRLKKRLPAANIVTLPTKDLRSFKNEGGTEEILNAILSAYVG